METRLFISDLQPAMMEAKTIGDVVWIDVKQGNDTISLMLPSRMEAAARMIAEAFNAHMMGGPITKLAQTGIPAGGKMVDGLPMLPSGGALSAEGALAVAMAQIADGYLPADGMVRSEIERRETMARLGIVTSDEHAAHAVERRDLP